MNEIEKRVSEQSAVISGIMTLLNDEFVSTLLSSAFFVATVAGANNMPQDVDSQEMLDLSEKGLKVLLASIADDFGVELGYDVESASLVEFYNYVAKGMRNDR